MESLPRTINASKDLCRYCETQKIKKNSKNPKRLVFDDFIALTYPIVQLYQLKKRENTEMIYDLACESLQESWISNNQSSYNTMQADNILFLINFNQSGGKVATSSVNDINIWDMGKRSRVCHLAEHTEIVSALEWFNGDESENFVSGSLDKTIKIWKDNECRETLKHHKDWLRCLSINKDNSHLLSGCVSSVVMGYDLQKGAVTFNIKNSADYNTLNTINSLKFQSQQNNFMAGTRDGMIRFFDFRDTRQPALQFYSHANKLNSAEFSFDDIHILSSGRDSSARLWDLRNVKSSINNRWEGVKGYLLEYKGHVSQGYNIASHFMANEKYVVTGSEDSNIYIYRTRDANIVKKFPTKSKIVHLLTPFPGPSVGFAYSGLQENAIHFMSTEKVADEEKKFDTGPSVTSEIDYEDSTIKIVEEFMTEYGDLILKIFHKNNFTYSSGMTWENLLKVVLAENDQESRELLIKFKEILLKRMQYQFGGETGNNAANPNQLEESKNQNSKSFLQQKAGSNQAREGQTECYMCRIISYIKAADQDCQTTTQMPEYP